MIVSSNLFRLRDRTDLNCVPDHILLNIFSYLNVRSLCQSSQVKLTLHTHLSNDCSCHQGVMIILPWVIYMPESEGMVREQLAPWELSNNTLTNLWMALYWIVFNHITILCKRITIKKEAKRKILQSQA